jgi:apolipoprotein D and lipocalin family protein
MGIKLIFGLGIGLLIVAAAAAQESKRVPVKTVGTVDLARYQGKWYEIAKFPNRFQKKCAGNTTAMYSLKPENRVTVINECRSADGKTVSAMGEARVVEGSSNTKLKVRFAPSFLSFLPFVWGDYWVIDLDPRYRYAAVGSPDRQYFWILSRTQTLDDRTYEEILNRAESQGYDRSKVVKTPQS